MTSQNSKQLKKQPPWKWRNLIWNQKTTEKKSNSNFTWHLLAVFVTTLLLVSFIWNWKCLFNQFYEKSHQGLNCAPCADSLLLTKNFMDISYWKLKTYSTFNIIISILFKGCIWMFSKMIENRCGTASIAEK